MAVKQLHLNDVSKTPIEPVISNDSIADNMITLNKLSEPVVTEDTYNQDKNTFVTKAELTTLESSKQDIINGKVTSFKAGTQFTGNLLLDIVSINDATLQGVTDVTGVVTFPMNTDLQIEGKGLKQYIVDNIPPSTGGGGAGVQLSAPNTATNGTITQGQLTTLQESDLNYIIFNNEIYSLNDKTHTADTLTYSHVGFENGKHLLKTISITVSTRAWVLNTTKVTSSETSNAMGFSIINAGHYSLVPVLDFTMEMIFYDKDLGGSIFHIYGFPFQDLKYDYDTDSYTNNNYAKLYFMTYDESEYGVVHSKDKLKIGIYFLQGGK